MVPRWERLVQWGIVLGATAFVTVVGGRASDSEALHHLRNTLRRDLVGCFRLVGRSGHLLNHYEYYGATPMVSLDSTVQQHLSRYREDGSTEDGGTLWRLIPLDSSGHLAYKGWQPGEIGPSWAMDSLHDTLYLSFSDGFSGAELILWAPIGVGDTLRGRITDNWDFGPPFVVPHGRGLAMRVQCAA